jgi:CopG family transcriptional regulator, nickel-responsive regulator
MPDLTRCSISLDTDLLQAFDDLVSREGYPTRSEGIKALIRQSLVEKEWDVGGLVAGVVVLVYDHHKRGLVHQLMHIQHDYGQAIISSQHVHLDHDSCMEMVTVRGEAVQVRQLVTTLRSVKGLKHTALVTTAAGASLP